MVLIVKQNLNSIRGKSLLIKLRLLKLKIREVNSISKKIIKTYHHGMTPFKIKNVV
jgi:hypothetical protein